ncbi:protein NDR1 [Pyrus x bretschneideri]|uniref:protein NDR1 n=1 Tax=Pyrus x bretschneideri TaxID=225117 RepID=UPI0020307A86|nr:protein NDR1 [Pyrus x bretschneideri]
MCETKNFYCWALQFLALLGLLALCLWLALRPKDPVYTIVDINIPKSDLEDGANNGSILYALQIENRNKDSSIFYDETVLTFLYGSDSVGEKHIPAFHQGRGKTRQVIDYVDVNARVWKTIRKSLLNATAELKVALLSRVRYKTWGVKSKHHGLDLQGKLSIGSDGKIFGKKKKIKLGHSSKKWRRSNSRRLLD